MAGSRPSPFGESDPEVDNALWQLAVESAGVGVFDWDLQTGQLRWDDRLLTLFGRDRASFAGTIAAFDSYVHADDRDRVSRALTQAIETLGEYESEYRIVLPSGRTRWIRARGLALPGPDGTAHRVVGAAIDSGVGSDEEARASRVLEAMPTAFFHLNRDWRFTYVNPVAQRLLGAVSTDPVGHVVWDLFPDAVGTIFEESYRRAAETQEPVSFEAYYPPPLDNWYEVRAWPTPDGVSVYFLDITERRADREALERQSRREAMLAAVTGALSETLDPVEAVSRLAELLVPEVADWCIVTIVVGDPARATGRRELRDIGAWHADADLRPQVDEYARHRLEALRDDAFLFRALRSTEPILIETDATAAISAVLAPGLAFDRFQGLAPESAVIMPLRGHAQTHGLLTLFRSTERSVFTSDDLEVLRDVGVRAGMALGNARAFAEQRDLAEGLQRSLLTAPPESDHLDVAVRYEPARHVAQVGGDWYDSFVQPSGTTIVIGDVVGHDTAAAAAMGQVRSLLRGIAMTTDEGPADVLHRVDAVIDGLRVETTASVVVARFEPEATGDAATGVRLRWSNAGHPPPLMAWDAGDGVQVRELHGEDTDLLLGMFPDTTRSESVVDVPAGATVLLYTDGLVERRAEGLDQGISRLASVLRDLVVEGADLEHTCDEVLARLLSDRPSDDVAIVAVRLRAADEL